MSVKLAGLWINYKKAMAAQRWVPREQSLDGASVLCQKVMARFAGNSEPFYAPDWHRAARISDKILDLLAGADCPDPEAALLASLLLAPEAFERVRELLPVEGSFFHVPFRKVYAAMLKNDRGDLDVVAWASLLADESGLTLDFILSLLSYEFYNCTRALLYARMVFASRVQDRMLLLSKKLEQGAQEFPIDAIDETMAGLASLRKRIMEANL